MLASAHKSRGTSGVFSLVLVALLGIAPGVAADTPLGSATASGEVELGYESVSDEFGSAKYEQYRDDGPGLIGSGRFLLEDESRQLYLIGRFDNLTGQNQEYELRIGRYARYRLELGFSQLPQVYSNNAVSPYLTGSDAQLVLPAGFARTNDPATLAGQLATFGQSESLAFRQRDTHLDISYRLGEEVTLSAGYRLQQKKGTQRLGMGYGNPGPFGSFVNVAVPRDEDLREVTARVEWGRGTWSLGLDYRGAFFRNDFDSATVENPFATGPARGRAALPPDNSSHSFSLSGATTLDLGFPARLAGTVSLGFRSQDESFLAHTINPALAGDPSLVLPAGDLDGQVLTYLANLVLTARPRKALNLTLRYRLFAYDDRTDTLTFPVHVDNDNSLSSETLIAARNEYTRQKASAKASYRIGRTTLDLGYDWQNWNRNSVRQVTHTNEHTTSAKIRFRPTSWAEVRAGYALSLRNGNDYDFASYAKETREPADVPGTVRTTIFPALRKFPQADRVRNQLDALATLQPTENLSLTLTGAYSNSDFDNSDFGLTDESAWNIGVDAEYRTSDRLGFSAHYTYDDARRKQRSRTRPRNFVPPIVVIDDPANDWKSRSRDRAHNFGIAMDVVLIPNQLDAELSWEYQNGRASTRASGDGGAAEDYPSVKDNLQILSAVLHYDLRENIAVKAGYRFERFNASNFQRDDEPAFSTFAGTANGLFLRDSVDDYEAHILALSVLYKF